MRQYSLGVSVLVRRLGFVWRERFGFAASTCGRNYCGAKCVTSPEQGAPPDRKKRHSIRPLTARLVAPLFAAGELGVLLQCENVLGLLVFAVPSLRVSCKYLRRVSCRSYIAARAQIRASFLGFCRFGVVSLAQVLASGFVRGEVGSSRASFSYGATFPTLAPEQGAAPDRLQLRSFRSQAPFTLSASGGG